MCAPNPLFTSSATSYPSGKAVDFVYDANGWLSSVAVGGQAAISQIQFAAFGPIKQWSAGGKTYTRTFNQDGEVIASAGADGSVTYARNLAGLIENRTDVQGAEGYAYDAVGRLIGYAGAGGDQSYGYDANGNRVGHLLGGEQLIYDYQPGNNRLADIQTLTNAYTYDAPSATRWRMAR